MNVTFYAIAALVVLLAIGGAGVKGYNLGQDHTRAEYAARDLKQANENAAETKRVQDEYRAKEQAAAVALAAVSTDYQRRLKDAEGKKTAALAAVRAGTLVLRDPGTVREACPSGTTETAASTSGRNGETSGGLSAEASGFLLSEAARADAYTEQLGACQAALEADRR